MNQTNLLKNNANYSWNFLNYPIHTISANSDNSSTKIAILLIHGFGASTDHWRFNIPEISSKFEDNAGILKRQ